ncbi:nicotinamide mononucleotide adenylyltransferase [Vibrio phage 2.275.O._10N.286.54.E11]|nr:nicotinamide mononucleotide adenylyltransferase [Vibrio phage 2.275.O._10N.286.54.E11]
MKQEKVYAYIGRFQGAHNGHYDTTIQSLAKCDHLVIVVGSYEKARDPKNPFQFKEIKAVLEEMLEPTISSYRSMGISKKLSIVPVHDYVYNNTKWLSEVQSQVSSVTNSSDITLTGYNKDESSFYLKFFPQWKQDFLKESVQGIDATTIRNSFFGEGKIEYDMLPDATAKFLANFKLNHQYVYDIIRAEHKCVLDYKEDHKDMPWQAPFLTGDAVVTCAGHILLIERGEFPGKGLWALPGGFFKNQVDATIPGDKVDYDQIDSAIRELREETKLKVPYPVLRGCIRESVDFTHPNRSLRWRIMTKASYIVLNDTTLPRVRGSDDAKKAMWIPINDVKTNRSKFFEDHVHIIDTFLGVL